MAQDSRLPLMRASRKRSWVSTVCTLSIDRPAELRPMGEGTM
jgi:hypothetical protein